MIPELEAEIVAKPNRRPFHYMRYFSGPFWADVDRLLVGSKVVYNADRRFKYIDHSVWPLGPLEVVRPYLRTVWKANKPRTGMGARRVPWRKEALGFLDLNVPNWFDHPRLDADLAYVDLDAAFFSIYSRLTLDCVYKPGRYLGLGRIPFLALDELQTAKELRNAVAGMFRARVRREYHRGQLVLVDEVSGSGHNDFNHYLAPDLWGVMTHILHDIAYNAVHTFGAYSWATDGGVFEVSDADRFMIYLRNTWGLSASARASGRGSVVGMTRWQIGEMSLGGRWAKSVAVQPIHGILPLSVPVRRHLHRSFESLS